MNGGLAKATLLLTVIILCACTPGDSRSVGAQTSDSPTPEALTVVEALDARTGAVRIRAQLVLDDTGARLCDNVLETETPACSTPNIIVESLDVDQLDLRILNGVTVGHVDLQVEWIGDTTVEFLGSYGG